MSVIEARSEAWHAQRRQGIGGSEAGKVMAGEWIIPGTNDTELRAHLEDMVGAGERAA